MLDLQPMKLRPLPLTLSLLPSMLQLMSLPLRGNECFNLT
uniref:Uncharacterized protein n=1 Tax=Picea glauca TaxID=3330 RepID=A0A101LUA6_PICGL|nr:hypothetical protein ABT39_MTgene2577 [Picea glauca]QHR87098.1 hypothetical protein Q903MT_gene1107 [Picea sitchensis]